MDDASGSLAATIPDAFSKPGAAYATPGESSPRFISRIAVRTRDRLVIVPTAAISRVDAEGNYVRLWTDRSWLHKETLTGLAARLDPQEFLRVHRSHLVSVRAVRELLPRAHGEFRIRLVDGAELTSGRAYRELIRRVFAI